MRTRGDEEQSDEEKEEERSQADGQASKPPSLFCMPADAGMKS